MSKSKIPISTMMRIRNRKEAKVHLDREPKPGDRVEVFHGIRHYKQSEGIATLIRPTPNPFQDQRRDDNGQRWYVTRWEVIFKPLEDMKALSSDEVIYQRWIRINQR